MKTRTAKTVEINIGQYKTTPFTMHTVRISAFNNGEIEVYASYADSDIEYIESFDLESLIHLENAIKEITKEAITINTLRGV
jgi:hypothetical protein